MNFPFSQDPATAAAIEAERLRLFVAGVTDYAIYMLSPEGYVDSWNAGAQKIKGYSKEEILGQHFSRFYTEKDKAANRPVTALQTAISEGRFEDEGWRVRKDGSKFWASVVLDAIRDTSGALIGFTKITRDITDRKVADEALYASEERFRLLVEGVTDYAIYMLSPKGEVTNWNTGAERIKGYQQHEIVGSHFSRFYTDEDKAKDLPMKALAAAAENGSFESEGWRVRKDGTRFWAHVVIDAIRNNLGELIGFAKITRDSSDRKALEKAQQALFQSQKMEAIGKLTGGVAHDFNNLLSVIVNGLTLLRMTLANDNEIRVLDSMERAASRGTSLTQQLLSFARQQPLKQDPHDVNRIINSFEAVLRRVNKSSIDLKLKLAPVLPRVMIDPQQLEAALLNLVVNSGDAMPVTGTIELYTHIVELREHEVNRLPAGHYVKITVKDTGEGMPSDVIAKAVEPFFTTKPVGKGTGLGLSQVYGLMQQSKGDLHIKSTLGRGTSISLYLPALKEPGVNGVIDNTTHDKALVVDDQPDVLDMAVELFRTLGYEVLSANNGEDAMDILQRTPDIDVLFSDVVMPGMSGIDLGLQARALAPNMRIILASGYAAPALKLQNDALDQFEFITKPYRISEIVKKLRVGI